MKMFSSNAWKHIHNLGPNKKKYVTINSLECNFGVYFLESTRYPPSIWLFVLVVQWFDLLLFLHLAELCWIRELEELRCKFDQPSGINGSHFSHVFLCSQYQFKVCNPAK